MATITLHRAGRLQEQIRTAVRALRLENWYLEHLGMRGNPDYDKEWARKESWYRQNGYHGQLLTTPGEGLSLQQSLEDIFCGRFGYARDQVR